MGAKRVRSGAVPEGNYVIWADFGQGLTRSHGIRLLGGDRATITCVRATKKCKFRIR